MKRRRCHKCKTWMRFESGDASVSCGECGARYEITQRARGGLQGSIQRALRKALAAAPSACKRCQGTGLRNVVVAERAAVAAAAKGLRPPATSRCQHCAGTGTAGGAS